ncbi:MAG TPA: hypothetical protein VKY31_12860 [Terriglobia bacterium]|nr:hypothetical protein [Terriglobia bacterium]
MAVEVDTFKHCVRTDGSKFGKRGSGAGEFHYPMGAVVVDNRAYVADSWNHRVQVFELPQWKFVFEFGDFFRPNWIGVVHDRDGSVLAIVDTNNCRICFHRLDGTRIGQCPLSRRRFPISARVIDETALEVVFEDDERELIRVADILRPPYWTTKLHKPISLARDLNGFIYVSDIGRRAVEKFDADGEFLAQILGPDVLLESGRMILNGLDLIVTDRASNAVFIYDTAAGTHRKWKFGFDSPGFLGRDSGGRIWVGTYREQPDPCGARFDVFTPEYQFLRTVTFPQPQQPTSICFMHDRILIADQAARNVLMFLPDGTFTGFLRKQPYEAPVWSLALDDDSHVYIGAGTVSDILWAPDLQRMYYIDFENAAVRYSEACTLPSKL